MGMARVLIGSETEYFRFRVGENKTWSLVSKDNIQYAVPNPLIIVINLRSQWREMQKGNKHRAHVMSGTCSRNPRTRRLNQFKSNHDDTAVAVQGC
jgi:hypothetical protein